MHLARPTDTLLLSTILTNCNPHLHRHLHRFSTNGQHRSFQTGTDMQRWSINGWRWKRIRASLEMRLIGTRRFCTNYNLFVSTNDACIMLQMSLRTFEKADMQVSVIHVMIRGE